MSTDHQQYSTDNQRDKIREYAARRGIEIVRTYADEGKSGLRIDGRQALQRLIKDVENGSADFQVILAYDVSRWGRFQDADESAYYESGGDNAMYAHRIASYFVKALTFVPRFSNERDGVKRSEDYKVFILARRQYASVACCLVNSSLFYMYYIVCSDAYHCGRELINQFPVDIPIFPAASSTELRSVSALELKPLHASGRGS